MRVGYFGPEGTFTHEALIATTPEPRLDLVSLPTIYDTVMAVHGGVVERALVPIENSLEGSVNATLDALAMETEDVAIVGEVIHPIRHCLVARTPLELGDIETVVSHPQATAQCARFIRTRLPGVRVLAGASTADAVRLVAEHDGRWAPSPASPPQMSRSSGPSRRRSSSGEWGRRLRDGSYDAYRSSQSAP